MIGHLLGAAGAVEAIAAIQVSLSTNITVERPAKSTILVLCSYHDLRIPTHFSWFCTLKRNLAASL